jgi:hypothetical protein
VGDFRFAILLCLLVSLTTFYLLDFDVDGFGTYFAVEHAQLVNGFGPFGIQTLFVEHIFAFFLKGISRISADGVELNIMRESGK